MTQIESEPSVAQKLTVATFRASKDTILTAGRIIFTELVKTMIAGMNQTSR